MRTNDQVKRLNKKFFDFWAKTYDWCILKPWLYHIQKKVVSHIKLKNKSNILDVGCGTGDSLVLLNKLNENLNLYGIDISEKMLKRADKKLHKKAVLKLGDVENIRFQEKSFDYVINTEAFHHFPDPNKATKEMSRVLKKNGKLIIADINFYFNFIHWLFKKIEPGHVKIYNEKEFQSFFLKNNLKIKEQKRIGLFVILTVGEKN